MSLTILTRRKSSVLIARPPNYTGDLVARGVGLSQGRSTITGVPGGGGSGTDYILEDFSSGTFGTLATSKTEVGGGTQVITSSFAPTGFTYSVQCDVPGNTSGGSKAKLSLPETKNLGGPVNGTKTATGLFLGYRMAVDAASMAGLSGGTAQIKLHLGRAFPQATASDEPSWNYTGKPTTNINVRPSHWFVIGTGGANTYNGISFAQDYKNAHITTAPNAYGIVGASQMYPVPGMVGSVFYKLKFWERISYLGPGIAEYKLWIDDVLKADVICDNYAFQPGGSIGTEFFVGNDSSNWSGPAFELGLAFVNNPGAPPVRCWLGGKVRMTDYDFGTDY